MHTQTYNLITRLYKQRGYHLKQNAILEGASGLTQTFNLLAAKPDDSHVIQFMDWKRTVGVNMVINMDRAAADVGIKNVVIVAEVFSDHAKAYAKRKGLTLVTKRDLVDKVKI